VELVPTPSAQESRPTPRAIAVVSGKGGTGKTMLSAVAARVLDEMKVPTLIVDADTGTGGLTYYLGLKQVSNITVGLADVIGTQPTRKVRTGRNSLLRMPEGVIQNVKGFRFAQFFGVGDHRRLYRESREEDMPRMLANVVRSLRGLDCWMIIDCRGGIDRESVAVCNEVDDILLVVESDTTSFQASQHLVDVLTTNGVAHKIRGFIINKVFDDPSTIARTGTSVFRSQYLASIPFDLEATRDFLVGDIPSLRSLFGTHVWAALNKAYPEEVILPLSRVWDFKDFREVGLSNLESLRGGVVISATVMALVLFWWWGRDNQAFQQLPHWYWFISAAALGILGGIEPFRRAVGRVIDLYVRILNRSFIVHPRRRSD
jgi:septum site-determining protein MinD